MFRSIALCLIAMALATTNAPAAAPKESGFFIGAMAGSSEFDDDGAFSWTDFDDTDGSIMAFAGYKFMRHFAVEVRYGNLGTFTVEDGSLKEELEFTVFSGHVVGLLPFGESGWELYGQIGLGNLDIDCRGCGSETAGAAGLGIRFSPIPKLAIGLQVDAYAWEDGPFDFAVSTGQFVVQYMF
jgi:hypothetical protein